MKVTNGLYRFRMLPSNSLRVVAPPGTQAIVVTRNCTLKLNFIDLRSEWLESVVTIANIQIRFIAKGLHLQALNHFVFRRASRSNAVKPSKWNPIFLLNVNSTVSFSDLVNKDIFGKWSCKSLISRHILFLNHLIWKGENLIASSNQL